MAIMAMDMAQIPKRKLSLLALCLASYPLNIFAGEWQFIPSVSLTETYTDNVELSHNNKQSSFVNQARATLQSYYRSPHLEFDINASSILATFSHDHDLDDDFKSLSANTKYNLWQGGPALIGRASIQNQARSSAQNSLADIISRDTVETSSYSAGVEYGVNNSEFSLVSSALFTTSSADDSIGEYDGTLASISAQSNVTNNDFLWQINANYEKRENNSQDGTSHRAKALVGYALTNKVSPFIQIYDEDSSGSISGTRVTSSQSWGPGLRVKLSSHLYFDAAYNYVDDKKLSDDYVSGTIIWEPSSRTQLFMEISQRFYGDSYKFNFKHRTKRLTNTISYDEQIQAFDRNSFEQVLVGVYLCPIQPINELDINTCFLEGNSSIDITGFQPIPLFDQRLIEGSEFSLTKSLDWQSELNLSRTSFVLTAQNTERESLTTGRKDDAFSASFAVTRRFNSKSDLNLKASFQRQKLNTNTTVALADQNDYYRSIVASFNQKLARTLTASYSLQYLTRDSSQLNRTYNESRAVFTIRKDF